MVMQDESSILVHRLILVYYSQAKQKTFKLLLATVQKQN